MSSRAALPESDARAVSQRAGDRQSLLLNAAGRAVSTTAWAVLADLGAPVASAVLAGFVELGAGLDQPGPLVDRGLESRWRPEWMW